MSIWTRITEAIAALVARGEGLLAIFERRRRPERSVAFTISVIGLGAKMAKADGLVRPAEVSAFRQVFQIAPEDEPESATIPDGESEHAIERTHHRFALLGLQVHEHFAVAVLRKLRATALELPAKLADVVDFSVADHLYGTFGAG